MEGQNAVGGEVFFVQRQRLSSKQMQRYSIARKGVDGEDVEALRGFVGE